MPGLTISCLILKRMEKLLLKIQSYNIVVCFSNFLIGGFLGQDVRGGVGVWIERNMFSMARGQKIRKTNLDSESGWVSPRE